MSMSSNIEVQSSLDDTNSSIIKGIFNPDVVISNLLNIGLKDLRANPWELNLVFNYLLDSPQLGDKEKKNAITWFLKTNIPVQWSMNLRPEVFPCFSYSLEGGDLQEQTLGSVNSDTQENKKAQWEALTPKFQVSYDIQTGTITIPLDIINNYHISEEMVMVNYDGKAFNLTDIDLDTGAFIITPNTVITLKDCYIRNSNSRLVTNIESASFKDIIRVGIHSINDPINAIWMFNICKYIILKYNKVLLEAKGFECMSIQYSGYYPEPRFPAENIVSRMITLTGKVRDYWSGYQSERISSVATMPSYSPVDTETTNREFGPEANITDPGYLALLEQDPYGR
jgi:hypothetical protein